MKKTIILFAICAIFISSCSLLSGVGSEPTPVPPTPTAAPTATPDPCASENLLDEVEELQNVINKFQDVAYVANVTPFNQLVFPVLDLQEIRRELQHLEVPECQMIIKESALSYMNSTINYFVLFMAEEDQETVNSGIQNSQVLWQVLLGEFSNLLGSAGLIEEEVPDISSAVPSATDSGIFITNDGFNGINVRALPDLEGEILTSLEPGMQAIGIARNEAGDWVQINLDGVIGWVFAETVTATEPIEDLPVFEAVE